MNALGSLSQMYMFILLVLLFLGSGLALWGFINFLISKKPNSKATIVKGTSNANGPAIIVGNEQSNIKKTGGYFMNNNGWIKLAVFSFVGIIVSVIVLGFVSTGSNQGLANQHGAQVQGGTQIQGGTMQMQNTGATNDQTMMQQQLSQMQQQLTSMQQQMGMMQNNTGTNMSTQSNMSSMPPSTMPQGGGMMTMMGGMMDMMGNMNNMQQPNSTMTNMPAAPAAPAMAPMPMM